MRVLLTGSTGFVGSYTVPALLAAGHEVVALARSPAKAEALLPRRGVAPAAVDIRAGDILDRASIESALDGCDAVIHTAAAIGVTSGGQVSVYEQNVEGTRNVVGPALERGCDPVIHLSSIAVFVPPDAPVITTASRLADPRNEYGRSKVQSERELRARQDVGEPVTIVYPGGVVGPDQPTLDAALEGVARARTSGWPMAPGGVNLLDVRDLAEVLAAAVVPGLGPRRLLVGGHYLTWPEYADLTDELLGVRVRRIPLPKPLLYGTAAVLDVLRRIRPIAYPLTRDAAEFMATTVPTDDAESLAALGVTLRPVEETALDMLQWLVDAGHITGKAAGTLRRTP